MIYVGSFEFFINYFLIKIFIFVIFGIFLGNISLG